MGSLAGSAFRGRPDSIVGSVLAKLLPMSRPETIDPVCGMSVAPGETAHRAEHAGETYHFCSEHCRVKFEEDPASYLEEREKPSARTRPGQDLVYTCPMHPEVEQEGPGDCPKCGMDLEPQTAAPTEESDADLRDMQRRFWISLSLTIPLLIISMSQHVGYDVAARLGATGRWLQFLLSTPVVLWAGALFFQRGYKSVLNRSPNMWTLITLGTGTAYVYSIVALIAPGIFPEAFRHEGTVALHFEAAATIITLILLGQMLELRARKKTGDALRELMELAPDTAIRIEAGEEREVPLDEIREGDLLRVRPGDQVPVDGEIQEGSSSVDESMITGEAMPVAKQPGDQVTGGTLNKQGSFKMEARKVGSDTALSQIVELVGKAQRSRAGIQDLADKVAAWFVPAVILVAIVPFLVWSFFGPAPAMGSAPVPETQQTTGIGAGTVTGATAPGVSGDGGGRKLPIVPIGVGGAVLAAIVVGVVVFSGGGDSAAGGSGQVEPAAGTFAGFAVRVLLCDSGEWK